MDTGQGIGDFVVERPRLGGARARESSRRPSPPPGVLRRNDTSFPTQLAAKLRVLHDRYLLALSDPDDPEHVWVRLLRYYQYLLRAVFGDPTYGLGADGNARGLLLYLATGIGKTRAAVGIAMALWDDRPVVVMLPRSLRQNFLDTVATVVRALNPAAAGPELAALLEAAAAHFAFVSMDAYNAAAQLARAGRAAETATSALAAELASAGGLDGKLLIVDEAHNFFRAIINNSAENANARRIYEMVMGARDLLLVFLTGTPAAKDPFELVPCFNMLAGFELLPTLYETFYEMYVDRAANSIRNRGKLANRLVGLVSHVAHGLPTEPPPRGSEGSPASGPAPRSDGWFPEVLPARLVRVEMAPEQYRVYLLAREKEEAEGAGRGGPSGPAPPRLALPGAAKKAMGSYYVGSRTASIFVPPAAWRGTDVDAMPDEAFTAETAPKLAEIARLIVEAPGPVLVYSQFVESALRPLGRFLQKAGLTAFQPELGPDARQPARSIPVVAAAREELGALWEARPGLRDSVAQRYRPLAELDSPGTHYFALDPEGLFAAHALVASAPSSRASPPPLPPPPAAEGRLWLEEVFTWPELRRRGFGRAVARWALASNPTAGFALAAEPEQAPGADALWRQLGFADAGAFGGRRLLLRGAGQPGGHRGTYAIISGKVPEAVRTAIRTAEVLAANAHGEIIKALLVSKTGAEGLDLKWIRVACIVEPYWDRARHDQVFGRGSRQGSHDGLPTEEREVQPVVFLATANQRMWGLMKEADREAQTIDEVFYERAGGRYSLNLEFRRLLAEVSLECELFGYGACRVCVPTNTPLFHLDPAVDLRLPDPCRAQEVAEVAVTPVQLDGATFFAAPDPDAPQGWAFYRWEESLGGHAPVDPADPLIQGLLAAVRGASARGGAARSPRGRRGPPAWCNRLLRGLDGGPQELSRGEAEARGLALFHGEALRPEELAAVAAVTTARLPADKLPRLASDLPTSVAYRQGVYPRRLATHFGQRKLLLSEVDFLTDFARPGDTVVYAGSAPGTHIPFLAGLFRPLGLKFVLFDPRDFSFPGADPAVLAAIATRNEYFTDETAKSFAGRDDVLFVSDVRTGTEGPVAPSQETVAADMAMQAEWVRLAQPRAAMLKFRLDYDADPAATTAYLAGSVRLQAWAPETSTETRLVAERPYTVATYRPRAHESQMFYYNAVLREWAKFDHGVPLALAKGLDFCPDCAQEVRIWRKFLGPAASPAAVARLINEAARSGSQPLDRPPHGLWPELLGPARRDRMKNECSAPRGSEHRRYPRHDA